MPKMTPNWSQRGSQNGAKIVKNEVLEASCFKDGSQVASRDPPGSILERFWDHFGTILVNFLTYFLWFLHAFCSSMLQTKTFKIIRNQQKNAAESFQETASLFVQPCIEKITSARQRAFRSLLVQVETGQMSAVETGHMTAAETYILSQQKTVQKHWGFVCLSSRPPILFERGKGQCHQVSIFTTTSDTQASRAHPRLPP